MVVHTWVGLLYCVGFSIGFTGSSIEKRVVACWDIFFNEKGIHYVSLPWLLLVVIYNRSLAKLANSLRSPFSKVTWQYKS